MSCHISTETIPLGPWAFVRVVVGSTPAAVKLKQTMSNSAGEIYCVVVSALPFIMHKNKVIPPGNHLMALYTALLIDTSIYHY